MANVLVVYEGREVKFYQQTGRRLVLLSTPAPGVFSPSGVGHSQGLVPDPGISSGDTRFLREDGTWQIPAGGSGLTQPQILARGLGA